MMKRLVALSVLSSAIAATGFASTAAAQWTFSPAGSFSLTNAGAIFVSKDFVFSCALSGSGTIAGGLAQVDSLSRLSGAFLCGPTSFDGLPYTLEPEGGTSLTSVTLKDVQLFAFSGDCRGDLTGAFNQATGEITFTNAIIPSDPTGGSPCVIDGTVSTTPAISYTIP